jgi:hypothetical protein
MVKTSKTYGVLLVFLAIFLGRLDCGVDIAQGFAAKGNYVYFIKNEGSYGGSLN